MRGNLDVANYKHVVLLLIFTEKHGAVEDEKSALSKNGDDDQPGFS